MTRMTTAIELPRDVAEALSRRAERVGQPLQVAGVQLLREALSADDAADPLQAVRLETDARTGLPVFRCRADAPARKMTIEQLLAMEQDILS
ncbi:MAG: hypothetical protein U0791_03600 [Gemmataceae bacterium]